MSSYYRTLIAKEVSKKILNEKPFSKNLELDTLQLEICKLIHILPTFRNSDVGAQFSIKSSDISKFLKNKVDIPLIEQNDIVSERVHNKVLFKVESSVFAQKVLSSVQQDGPQYGYMSSSRAQKCVCVEFSSPNIAKPFHVGHMRSTIIGNVISNMYEAAGHDVKRLNFLGDWGTQFGLLTLGLQKYADKEQLKSNPLEELLKTYIQINKDVATESGKGSEMESETYKNGLKLFAKLEEGDPELKSIWQKVKNLSLMDLEKMYQRLGVHFTHIMAESDYQSKTKEVLLCLRDASLLEYDSEGVGFVNMDKLSDHGRAVVVKSDGSSLYLTRDIAAALERHQMFNIDVMHYVVEHGQKSHFVKLVNILKHLGIPWANRSIEEIHIHFGRVQGMSTRAGSAVLLKHLLDQAIDSIAQSMRNSPNTRVTDKFDAVAETLAVSALVLQDLRDHRGRDYKFDWGRMLSFRSNSGVFAQYCHARLTSIISNCGVDLVETADMELLKDDKSLHKIVLHIANYPDVFEASLQGLKPHLIVSYLYNLCHLVNLAYSTCPVKGQPTDVGQARLMVFQGAKQVIANCLRLLGVQPLDEM